MELQFALEAFQPLGIQRPLGLGVARPLVQFRRPLGTRSLTVLDPLTFSADSSSPISEFIQPFRDFPFAEPLAAPQANAIVPQTQGNTTDSPEKLASPTAPSSALQRSPASFLGDGSQPLPSRNSPERLPAAESLSGLTPVPTKPSDLVEVKLSPEPQRESTSPSQDEEISTAGPLPTVVQRTDADLSQPSDVLQPQAELTESSQATSWRVESPLNTSAEQDVSLDSDFSPAPSFTDTRSPADPLQLNPAEYLDSFETQSISSSPEKGQRSDSPPLSSPVEQQSPLPAATSVPPPDISPTATPTPTALERTASSRFNLQRKAAASSPTGMVGNLWEESSQTPLESLSVDQLSRPSSSTDQNSSLANIAPAELMGPDIAARPLEVNPRESDKTVVHKTNSSDIAETQRVGGETESFFVEQEIVQAMPEQQPGAVLQPERIKPLLSSEANVDSASFINAPEPVIQAKPKPALPITQGNDLSSESVTETLMAQPTEGEEVATRDTGTDENGIATKPQEISQSVPQLELSPDEARRAESISPATQELDSGLGIDSLRPIVQAKLAPALSATEVTDLQPEQTRQEDVARPPDFPKALQPTQSRLESFQPGVSSSLTDEIQPPLEEPSTSNRQLSEAVTLESKVESRSESTNSLDSNVQDRGDRDILKNASASQAPAMEQLDEPSSSQPLLPEAISLEAAKPLNKTASPDQLPFIQAALTDNSLEVAQPIVPPQISQSPAHLPVLSSEQSASDRLPSLDSSNNSAEAAPATSLPSLPQVLQDLKILSPLNASALPLGQGPNAVQPSLEQLASPDLNRQSLSAIEPVIQRQLADSVALETDPTTQSPLELVNPSNPASSAQIESEILSKREVNQPTEQVQQVPPPSLSWPSSNVPPIQTRRKTDDSFLSEAPTDWSNIADLLSQTESIPASPLSGASAAPIQAKASPPHDAPKASTAYSIPIKRPSDLPRVMNQATSETANPAMSSVVAPSDLPSTKAFPDLRPFAPVSASPQPRIQRQTESLPPSHPPPVEPGLAESGSAKSDRVGSEEAAAAEAGEEALEKLAQAVYLQLRQRITIERERSGHASPGRLPW